MAAINPISTGRASDLLVRQRLLGQLHTIQSDLLRAQDQLATGLRLTSPSDDAPAAVRAMTLQRLLEQKQQFRSNLSTGQSFLGASENAGAAAAEVLIQIRGLAVTAADGATSDNQRRAAAAEIRNALGRILTIGNTQYRGRYVFGGTDTTRPPYELVGNGRVAYHGNANHLSSFVDLSELAATSVPGEELLGGLSTRVQSSVDLTPVLKADTRLADLHGGAGVFRGSFRVSDGNSSRVIDISGADTIGDVARLIESNPPAGRVLKVRIIDNRLEVQIDQAGGGNLTIGEIGSGTTASNLGILRAANAGTATVIGQDLNPRLGLTTRLDDVLGARAIGFVESSGFNNDLVVEARQRGAPYNGVRIQYVDDDLLQAGPGLTAGNETLAFAPAAVAARASLALTGVNNDLLLTANNPGISANGVSIVLDSSAHLGDSASAAYDSNSKVLTLHIDDSNETTLGTLVSAINSSGLFTAAPDGSAGEGFDAGSAVQSADAVLVHGNTGNSGGDPGTLFIHVERGATTANHVVAAARNNVAISDLFDIRLDDSDTSEVPVAGTFPVDLNATATTAYGRGIELDQSSGIQIVNAGEAHTIRLQDAETVEDLLNVINGSDAGARAEINAAGTGINVRSRISGVDFAIGENGGTTATELGLRTLSSATPLAELNHGRGVANRDGTDFVIRRSDGTELPIDIATAQTVNDVLNLINTHPANQDPPANVVARLAPVGNGIELLDANPAGTGALTVIREGGSLAATDLGLVPRTSQQASAVSGPTQILSGADVGPLEAEGPFNTLIRLADAVEQNDAGEIERLTGLLDANLDQLNFVRGGLGVSQQELDQYQQRLEQEDLQLKGTLSETIEVDLAQAISDLTSRQGALEAALRLMGRTFQLTLLNYL